MNQGSINRHENNKGLGLEMERRDNIEAYKKIKSNLIYGDSRGGEKEITFVIPTFKRPQKVQNAVNSILNQKTSILYDIVVVDNEPDFNTDTQKAFFDICREHSNVYYYKNEENIGMFPNWNRCYELSKGKWCCILMSDDELKSNYLERVVWAQRKYGLDCVRVGSDIYDQDGIHIREKSIFEKLYHNRKGHMQLIDKNYFLFKGALPPSGMFVRREAILNIGGYDLSYYPGSDYEFDTHLVTSYKVGMLWERLCITHTDDSTSMKKETIQKSILAGLKINKELNNERNALFSYLNNIKAIIGAESMGLDKADYDEIDLKWDKPVYKTLYKVAYHVNRALELIGIR